MNSLAALVLSVTPIVTISLADALSRAGEGAPVAVARAEAEAAAREVEVAGAAAAPVVTLGRTRYSAREELGVSQEVRWGGERRYGVLAARDQAASAAAGSERTLLEARRDVRQAWHELAFAEDAEVLAKEALARANEFLGSVSARVEGGRAPRLDEVRARSESSRLSAQLLAAAEARLGAWAHLASLIRLDPQTAGATDGTRPAPLGDAEREALHAKDVAAHPELRAAASALESAEASREAVRRRRLPGLTFSGGVNADDPGLPGPDWFGSVGLTLPLGAVRGRPARRAAEARVAVREAELEAARRRVLESREVAYRKVLGAAALLHAYDAEALPAAEETARLTREAYGYGRGDVFRAIEADRAFLEARSARLSAYKELMVAEAELLFSAGASDAR